MLRGFVEQVESWRRVYPNRVDAESRYQAEVFGDTLNRRELVAVRIGGERAVRHPLDEESLGADLQKFAVRDDSRTVRQRGARTHVG